MQDAHELLLDLLNDISELLEAEQKLEAERKAQRGSAGAGNGALQEAQRLRPATPPATGAAKTPIRTWVHDLFQARSRG